MRESALKDGNARAVKNIDYIYETPKGEHFEVDNDNLPIQAIVYKINKTRQFKPLQEKRDEDLLIEYFHKVDGYANSYYEIVHAVLSKEIRPDHAGIDFRKLDERYPGFPATYRAIGAVSLASAVDWKAVNFSKEAFSVNKHDPKALRLLSISEYALGNKCNSWANYKKAIKADPKVTWKFLENYKKAIKADPKVTLELWEEVYIIENKPKIYNKWKKYIKNLQQTEGIGLHYQ
jgi:tetratricopeptide (TPR) repeat protein